MAFNLIPYTNFHDLNLDWILDRVKEMISAKDEVVANMEAAQEAITTAQAAQTGAEAAQTGAEAAQLAAEAAQGYAEAAATNAGNYADTAQDIVNTALDNIGDATSGAVADWLAENVDPSTGYVVDKSLTIDGAAADARAVGVAVSGLRNFWKENYVDLTWNNYRITSGGNIEASTDYLLTDPIPVNGGIAVTIPDFNEDSPGFNPFYLYVALYSDENTFVSLSAAQSEGFAILADEGYYFRLMARYQTTATLAPANAPFSQIVTLSPTDTDIRAVPYAGEEGKAADARATSQALLELSVDKASASDLNDLRSLLYDLADDCDDGIFSIRNKIGGWVSGNFGTNGQIQTNTHRMTCTENILFDREVQILIASGRRCAFYTWVNNAWTDSGWKQGSYVIPANTPFRIVVSPTTATGEEENTWTTDIELYTSWITYKTEIREELDDIDTVLNITKQAENISWVTGYYFNKNNGTITAESGYKYGVLEVSDYVGGRVTGNTSSAPNSQIGIGFTDENNEFISGYASTATGQWLFTYDVEIPDGAKYFYISCRIASENMFTYPVFSYDYVLQNIGNRIGKIEDKSADNILTLENAKHIQGGNSTPLVLMHFSDLHGQAQTMMRLVDKMANISNVDDIICTGDMVRYKAEPIDSWWDENIMTCIGNHDTASFENNTYDWTALSMTDRDAYYIAPFESSWGITHTSGTSYYYKDYTAQNVRLIVMDAMLYNDNGAEATAQTAWLENLLASAITNSLHVLIAIHAPHGGATAEDCSFSRYGQSTMPTLSDCNTPQTVIDAVATKISAGLKFIGYLCGHTHQDNVWDAENNGKQLMYCITCATVDEVQWVNSDQYRGFTADAFNIVTVDTAHTLVKIIRCGGADLDDHMRVRKAICFDYSTGQMVGEIR